MAHPHLIILALVYLALPALVLVLCSRNRLADKIGAVVLCYIAGMALAQLLPAGFAGGNAAALKVLQESMMGACIALSLPLLLFSVNVRNWIHLGPTTLLAMASSIGAVVAMAFLAGWLLRDELAETWKLVGLGIALYTGGTPNLAAVKEALAVDNNLFLQLHTYDTFLTIAYLLFVASIAQQVFLHFLPSFQQREKALGHADNLEPAAWEQHYAALLRWPVARRLSIAVVLAAAIVALVVVAARSFAGAHELPFIMVGLTLLALAASLNPKVREIPHTFDLGMYIVLCFCVIVGSMITTDLFGQLDPDLALFVLIIVYGSVILHACICRLLRIDVDTFLITSVAAIASPPFVPMVAGTLKNREILLSGITAGIIGYALSNLLGVGLAYLFDYLF
ncbi:DUF819 family protein [Biformimicrobium ophioploci]|uniref:DUF819 family protein n=1 Tax=Biformimicrobium ophioploci TaxID=3036711 RepID=A0ABQ6LWV3_9GAMM|nr:DUF819 family protein [Microbulbifer sp. NKW57]GMG86497.1 hypothetical protein MNKW57_08180 [Microbulbifer sp. NKW57]